MKNCLPLYLFLVFFVYLQVQIINDLTDFSIMQNMGKSICIFILSVLALAGWAQPLCKVRTFGTGNGLPASVVSGIAQSTDNLIWLATWNGLSCFDGYRFTTFRNIPGHDSQLTTNHLISVMPAADGDLWVTAYSEDFYLFDSRRCQYVNVSAIIQKNFRSKFSLRKIYPLANGDTWIVGKYNDHYYMPKGCTENTQTMKQFKLPGTLNKVVLDNSGDEWLFCDQGAFVSRAGSKPEKVSSQWVDFVKTIGKTRWLVTIDGRILELAKNGRKVIEKTSFGVEKVSEVFVVNKYLLALATNLGVAVYDTRNGKKTLLSVQWPGNPEKAVDQMFKDSKGRLWCFNDGSGVSVVQPDMQVLHLAAETKGNGITVADKPIFHEDLRHTVWVASKDGAFSYFDEDAKQLVPQSLASAGFPETMIPRAKKAFSDHQGNLWMIYPHNLSLVSFSYSNISQIDLGMKRDTRSALIDHEGNIILGTVDGNVVKFSAGGNLIGYLAPSGKWQKEKSTFSYHIYSLYEDKRHRLWIGTKGEGVYCIDNGNVVRLRHDETNSYTLNSDDVYDIKEDTHGRLLVAVFEGGLNISSGSMYSGDLKDLKFYNCNNMLKGYVGDVFNKVRRIEVMPNGVVLLSTTQGLLTYLDSYTYPDRIRFYVSRHTKNDNSLYSSEVMQTLVAPDGKLYVVTLGGGLQCVDAGNLLQDNLRFIPVEDKDGNDQMQSFASGTIQSLVSDRSGGIWVIGESSIACISKNGLKEYGSDEIGGVNISEALPAHSSATDRIVIATEGGAITFLPRNMDRSSYAPNIVFTSIRYMDMDMEQPILNVPELKVDVDHRSFSIFFSALDYSSHSSVSPLSENCGIRYAYRIDDGDWVYVHPGSNSVSFNNFPAGSHVVSVRSTNGDGVWIDNAKELKIYAEPTFLESWWGRTIIWAILLGLAYYAFRTYMRKRTAEIAEEATEKADAGKVRYMLRKPEIVDEDKVFMDKLLAYIEEHIGDVDLKVDDMAVALSMGRSTFYARLKQIADMSPNDFLRHIRMKRAEDLVMESSMTFSQIAYTVGFSDPKYFGKCFKKHTGMSPSEYRKEKNERESAETE